MTIIDREWLTAMPKAENHVHLEGCLTASVVDRAAQRSGILAPTGIPTSLDELLHILDMSCRLMTDAADLTDLAYEKARAATAEGISYTDLIVNPNHWPAWQGRLPEMLMAFDAGFAKAASEGLSPTGLSFSIGRWQSADEGDEVVDALLGTSSTFVVGVAMDGNESAEGAGCERFAPAINRARAAGLRVHIHTGESGGADAMWRSLEHLDPDRIDHGIRSITDPELVAVLAEKQIPLAICPSSNVLLGFAPSLGEHPIVPLRNAGVMVTVNTDDPLLLGTDLVNEYSICAEAFGWGEAELLDLAGASITASSASDEAKTSMRAALAAHGTS